MSQVDKTDMRKYVYRLLIIAGIACLIGVLCELGFNYRVLFGGNRDIALTDEVISTENFELVDGKYTMNIDADSALIRIDMPQEYVHKLAYSFDEHRDFQSTIRVYTTEEDIENNHIEIMDPNNIALDTSYVKVDSKVSHIDIVFSEDSKGMKFSNFRFINEFNFSFRRFITITTIIALLLFMFTFGNIVSNRIEYVFLVAGLSIGFVMCITFPLQKESWDEAYHFKQAYNMAVGNAVITPEIAYYQSDDAVAYLLYPRTEEEYNQYTDYMNSIDIYDKDSSDNVLVKKGFTKMSDIGHIPSALGINVGRLFHMPFGVLYIIGKIFNMLFYVIGTFFAIKHLTIGKRLMAFLALMPTPMFLASTYSYDATLNACAFLALSYILTEIVDEDKCITWRNYLIFMVSMLVVCMIKMIYAPMLMLLLLLSDKKFTNKKDKIIMKYGVFILCIIVVAIMMLPTFISVGQGNTTGGGDSRGGATSSVGQLKHILSEPLQYAKLLLVNIVDWFVEFSAGKGIYGWYAHYGSFRYGEYFILATAFVVFTDASEKKLVCGHKIFMVMLYALITCFIWTAMYMSFTPVGANYIAGVQGRYFIPIIMLLYLCVNSSRIRNEIPVKIYNRLILGMPIIFNYLMMGYMVVTRCA